ncbi:putative anti-sigma regulatory factor, serine/threonine protein kinase [Catenulispora acidiphila DSM 44928]|uniref:Putative anti-sigma regulatory factor, serine/threonine protein kinase n=1 Tax=Catenulispora acidiphila (strain DSM 44928 / JCM 14897 / NBRC 102108 / NRRL B-24433 / ID139908) TaxID=479433 RepID=C7Q134_CATAD|nr:ATP-binding SpoIIE family protein phosphatase [Catenulispora acidiphila]ACU71709.1 putative anti-sigma regulatory factor, serine/threonine protein kinase [Catenulispora acidiphila DSM 44928]
MDALVASPSEGAWLRQEVTLAAQARRIAAELGRRIGLSAGRVAEIELAVTEVAVNLLHHADDGALLLRLTGADPAVAVELLAVDHGPGIADLTHSRRSGVSTGGTPGLGLGVVERMADVFDVHSLMGQGTVLVARFRDRSAALDVKSLFSEPLVAGLTRPISGEQICGDIWAAKPVSHAAHPEHPEHDGQQLVMLCDGLGHGVLAARASGQARTTFHRSAAVEPKDLIVEMHQALAGTRGGAAAVARIDWRRRRIELCGIGNVSAFVVTGTSRSALLSAPGIVGHHLPRVRSHGADLPAGSSVVLHSDGLTERWSLAKMPALFDASSTVVAAHLLREAGVRRDDASVVVIKDPAIAGSTS